MPQYSRFNLSFSLMSFMVLFTSQSSKSKSKSNSSSSSSYSCSPNNSPELHGLIDPSFSPSSSSESSETNKVMKKPSWPRKIGNKLKKAFVVNNKKSTKDNKNKSKSTSVDHYDHSYLASTWSPSTDFYGHRQKRSVRFNPVCVIVDQNSRPCGQTPLKLEPNYNKVLQNNNNNGQINFEFRRDNMKMQRDFFRYLDELENNEDEIVGGDQRALGSTF